MSDTEMLDWLESQHGEVAVSSDWHDALDEDDDGRCWYVDVRGTPGFRGKTLRAAVRAAWAALAEAERASKPNAREE
jgi:hypothetical protein